VQVEMSRRDGGPCVAFQYAVADVWRGARANVLEAARIVNVGSEDAWCVSISDLVLGAATWRFASISRLRPGEIATAEPIEAVRPPAPPGAPPVTLTQVLSHDVVRRALRGARPLCDWQVTLGYQDEQGGRYERPYEIRVVQLPLALRASPLNG
jgi:hypothetical protein